MSISGLDVRDGNGAVGAPVRSRLNLGGDGGRRPLRAVVLLVVAATYAALFALLLARTGNRQPVLAVARDVPAGRVIEPADLTVARVSADERVRPLATSARPRVVGRQAATTLTAGSLLTDAQLTERLGPGPDEAVVAALLKGSHVAPSPLGAGDRVQIVLTPAATEAARADGEAAAPLGQVLAEGSVLTVERPKNSADGVVVSVVVAREVAAVVAGAGAADRLALVRTGTRG